MRGLTIALFLTLTSACVAQSTEDYPPPPPKGYVPDADTAIAVAHAILVSTYGAKNVPQASALIAERQGDIWHVTKRPTCTDAVSCFGQGTEDVRLSAKDGRILIVYRHD